MPKPLTDGQQRLLFGVLVVVLVVFGVYLSTGGWRDGGDDGAEADNAPESGQDEAGGAANSDVVPPSPIPTTAADDMDVQDWLPFTEDELKGAAATAQRFAAAYGTIDYSQPPAAYYGSLEELATADYAETLAESSGAGALWEEMAQQEAVAQGRANVDRIRSFDDESVVFVVEAQSITQGTDGATENLGEFAITVVEERGEWRVFDFQPADSGNLGEG
ncbi:hypothetical protein HNR12_004110 [Streptomonospora nanhaiensis]|uniref:Mce-associated membrane protein n=1 Tax=Streptomonospora nanhaiensis TaxID=1323731 RepID=A0A853BRR6_9ACTN|nr:hypothetical protein [Streptomonospora nanhaiensis]NYI97833.1 hypothetical protein [Streptomonospora nanhaiensis]